VVDKELYSAFANVVVLGPGGSAARERPTPVTANTPGATTSKITSTPPALSAERMKRAIAWRFRKYRSRARRTYRKHVSRARTRLHRYRRRASRLRKGLDWHPQAAWRRFTANPDAARLSWECDIIAAADGDAVLTVWHIARRRPEVVAINGLNGLGSADLTAGHTSRLT
jgi:hypothetical protein